MSFLEEENKHVKTRAIKEIITQKILMNFTHLEVPELDVKMHKLDVTMLLVESQLEKELYLYNKKGNTLSFLCFFMSTSSAINCFFFSVNALTHRLSPPNHRFESCLPTELVACRLAHKEPRLAEH